MLLKDINNKKGLLSKETFLFRILYHSKTLYVFYYDDSEKVLFTNASRADLDNRWALGYTTSWQNFISRNISSWSVTSVAGGSNAAIAWKSFNYLEPSVDYSNPYMPQYDGSPATKKYIDDKKSTISVILEAVNWSSKNITVTAIMAGKQPES